MSTVVLRFPGIYGEQDWVFVTQVMCSLFSGWSYVPSFSGRPPIQQAIYAGNAAWAHLCAIKTLEENPRVAAGEVFSVTDDTPPGSIDELCQPFVINGVGFRYFKIPHRFVVYALCLPLLVLSIVRVFADVNLQVSVGIFKFLGVKITFSGRKFRDCCGFKPMFTNQESVRNSNNFYRIVVKDPSKFKFGGSSIFKHVSWIQDRFCVIRDLTQECLSNLFAKIFKKLY